MRRQYLNFLVVSGTGQNTGKTSLSCKIIEQFVHNQVVAVKISPHFHKLNYPMPLIYEGRSFKLFSEVRTDQSKDSSRFLRAGAMKAFLLLSEKDVLADAFDTLSGLIPDNHPVVCESGGIIHLIKPAIHLLLTSNMKSDKNPALIPDVKVTFDGEFFDFDTRRLGWNGNQWLLQSE